MSVPISPGVKDLYSYFFTGLYDDRKSIMVPTVGQHFFGNPMADGRTVISKNSMVVEIDIIRGSEKTAALIPRGLPARTIKGNPIALTEGQFSNFRRVYPLVEEEAIITANELNNIIAGEGPYAAQGGSITKFDRMRKKAADLYREMNKRIIRLFERLAWQSLLTGKQDAILGTANPDLQYDFRRNALNTDSVALPWTNALADPIGDLDGMCLQIDRAGHIKPNVAIMDGASITAFIGNTIVQGIADNRRFIDVVSINATMTIPADIQRLINAGLVLRGVVTTYRGYQLWLMVYTEHYEDDNGNPVDYLPEGTVFITSTKARADRYFGPDELLPLTSEDIAMYAQYFGFSPGAMIVPPEVEAGAIIPINAFSYDAYRDANRKSVTMRAQVGGPIFATTQTDAFGVLEDIIAE